MKSLHILAEFASLKQMRQTNSVFLLFTRSLNIDRFKMNYLLITNNWSGP